jgi:hypothetical protein
MYGIILTLALAPADYPDRIMAETTRVDPERERIERLLREIKEIIIRQERIRVQPQPAPRPPLGGQELSARDNDPPPADLGRTEQETELQRVVRALEAWEKGVEFVGLTEQQLRQRLGNPTSVEAGVWYYREPLGPGCRSFVRQRVVRFANGKVVSAKLEQRPSGCIIIERR